MTGPWLGVTALAQVEDFPRKGPLSSFCQKYSRLHEIPQVRITL